MKRLFLILLPLLLLASLPAMATDFYWVGGSGNWTDINHWRMGSSTGAIPLQAPTQDDDAYFDANSGFTTASKTVTISGNVTCRDITFDGCVVAPTLTFGSAAAILNIYGSSVWQAGMTLTGNGGAYIIYQDTGTPKTIASNGVAFPTNTHTVINETSTVDLLDDWEAGGGGTQTTCDLTINAGTFNTNDFRIDTYFFTANAAAAKMLNLGSSDIYVNATFQTNSASTSVNAATSTIHFLGNSTLLGNTGQQFNNVIGESATSSVTIRGNMTINRMEFRGNGSLGYVNEKNNVIGDLIVAAGKTYSFFYANTLTITNSIGGGASCAWTTFQSANITQTDPVIAVDAGATVNLTGIVINHINASGTGAPVTLNGSIDGAGVSTGWDYAGALPSQDLYWVGGTGNWSDAAHWSFTPGGAGGDCVPGPGNNVFFDANSGFTTASKNVILNGASYCKDITFAGAATPPSLLQSGAQTLNVYGSSTWQTGMTISISGISYQNTGEDKTITSNGASTGGATINIYETESISLNDDFTSTGIFALNAGTFDTQSHNVTGRIQSNATQLKPVTLNLGSSVLTLTGFTTNNAYTTVNAGTSHIYVSTTSISYGFQGYGGQHFYDVTLEGAILPFYAIYSTAANPTYFNRVEILNGVNMNSGFFMDMNSLTLAPGFTYNLGDTRVGTGYINQITVNESFTAGQDCAVLAVIDGHNNNTLSMPAGATVNVRNVMLQNSKTTGGATFTANNSVDNGGNTGWNFSAGATPALYWVGGAGDWNDAAHWSLNSGGAGGACVPGVGSDVFFDSGSGFTDASKTVTVSAGTNSYCRNVMVDGSPIPPIFTVNGTLNIYGSSIWQAGMTINNTVNGGKINYQNTGTPKTVTSNGVVMNSNGYASVYFYETASVSLTDDLRVTGQLTVSGGTLNTDNHSLTQAINGPNNKYLTVEKSGVLNLGSSVVVVNGLTSDNSPSSINLGSSQWTVGVGHFAAGNGVVVTTDESTITMTGTNYRFSSYGQSFHDVVFNVPGVITNLSPTQEQTFNSVVMKKGGALNGNNTYGSLYLMGVSTGNAVYTLEALKTQTVTGELVMMGTTCGQVQVVSSTTTTTQTKANLNVTGGTTSYNWVDMSDIDATSGLPLNLGTQGTSNRNLNVNYDASGPVVFSPFPDWTCHGIVASDADSYIINSAGFYGNSYSKYEWRDSTSTIIGTSDTLNIINRGNGTYTLTVTYYNAPGFNPADQICVNAATIVVYKTPPLTDIYSDPATPLIICRKGGKVTVVEGRVAIHGQAVRWYDKDGTLMDDDDEELIDGEMYQVTQTMISKTTGLDCESFKTNVYVKLVNCNDVYINPAGRMRVMIK